MEGKYLQLYADLEDGSLAQFAHQVSHINDPFLSQEMSKESQLRIINHNFEDKYKQKMIFFIEEVSQS